MRGNSDRFYIKDGLGKELLEINDKQLIRQWLKVMRFKEGDVIRLFDGSGYEYNYQIKNSKLKNQNHSLKPENCIDFALMDKCFVKEKESKVFLGFGILHDRARLEWMVEKCTELGVDGFVPLMTDNCQVVLNNSKFKTLHPRRTRLGREKSKPQLKTFKLGKIERLEKKIIEACEQCGRVRLPEIFDVNNIDSICRGDVLRSPIQIVVMEKGNRLEGKGDELKDKNILLLVGPEGGWSQRELEIFKEMGYQFLCVNENMLRADTAAIVGISLGKLESSRIRN